MRCWGLRTDNWPTLVGYWPLEEKNEEAQTVENRANPEQAGAVNGTVVVEEDDSLVLGAYTPAPPAPVLEEAKEVRNDTLTLCWKPVQGATHYFLDVSSQADFSAFEEPGACTDQRIEPTEGAETIQWTIDGLTQGTPYFYRVRSADACFKEGVYDSTGSVTTLDLAPPSPEVKERRNDTFTLSWQPVRKADQYQVDVSSAEKFSSFVMKDRAVIETEVTVGGLTPGTRYHYRMRSANSAGTTSNSNPKSVTTLNLGPIQFKTPKISHDSFTLSWKPVEGATHYLIDVSSNSTFDDLLPGFENQSITETTSTVRKLKSGTTYYYRVRSANKKGDASTSEAQPISTLSLPSPPLKTATELGTDRFTANWERVDEVVCYYVDVSSAENDFNTYLPGFKNRQVTETAISVDGLLAGTTYQYRVRCANAEGKMSENSPTQSVTIPAEEGSS